MLALLALAGCAAPVDEPSPPPVTATPPPPATSASVPALLLISVDTLRADHLSAYGAPTPITPHIDRLARRGVAFESARTAVPLTLPSHAVMMTGRLPSEIGIHDNGFVLDRGVPTLAELLTDASIPCAAVVGSYVLARRFGLDRGFDTYDDAMPVTGAILVTPERRAAEVVEHALAWLAKRTSPRWFLFVHLFDPHAAYAAPAPWPALAPTPYGAEISYTDQEVGRLLRSPAISSGAAAVMLTSDHGESLGEHGERTHGLFLYDATLRVPLLLVAPGEIAADTLSRHPARTVDVAPTIAELLGVSHPPCSGSALLPEPALEAPAYAETMFPYVNLHWSGSEAIVRGTSKLILSARSELYDLATDPGEVRELLADRPAEAAELGAALEGAVAGGAVRATRDPAVLDGLRQLGYVVEGAGAVSIPSRAERLALPDPKDGVATFTRYDDAITKLHAGELDAGIAILQRIVDDEPGNVLAQTFLGAAAFEDGELTRSARAFEAALAVAPTRADIRALLARTHLRAGDNDAASSQAALALASDPTLATALLVEAEVARRAGRLPEAVARLEEAARSDPGNPMVERPLVEVLLQSGDLAGAHAHIESILSRDPREGRTLAMRGALRARAGDRAGARRDFEAAVDAAPDSVPALVGLATAEAQADDLEGAIRDYERALALSADSPDLLNALALTLARAGHAERARHMLERSLEVNPEQASVRQLLADLEP